MHNVTRKSLKDSDINIFRIEQRLREIATIIKQNNKNNLTDINVICEEIFGKILNELYNIKLISLSAEISGNFVAVDLIDYEHRIAYQVTSVHDRVKIDKTIEKFNNSDLAHQIDSLNFLILDTEKHRYNGEDTIFLENGNEFSYSKNIMNFNKLIAEIEQKEAIENGIIVKIYDAISMVYDSGRLRYFSIVKATELLAENSKSESGETVLWKKGYGDIQLTAFIPLSYKSELSCRLEIRQHNLAGAYITFEQKTLLQDYFLAEEEFELRHNIGRYEEEEEMWMQLGHVRLKVNAHTAHHVYELFSELKEEYDKGMRRINRILGTTGLEKIGDKYYLLSIKEKSGKKYYFLQGDMIGLKEMMKQSGIFSIIIEIGTE